MHFSGQTVSKYNGNPLTQSYTLNRCIDAIYGDKHGKTVICICALHGNEPAGYLAMQSVFKALKTKTKRLHGSVIALTGNREALQHGVRFIDEDLNRLWAQSEIKNHFSLPAHALNVEQKEALAITSVLQTIFKKINRPALLLDLHTTSSKSKPFVIFGDTLRNRRLAKKLGVSCVLGLEEAIRGTLIEYVTDLGHNGLAYEAGQHDDLDSIALHEAGVWLMLKAAGIVREADFPQIKTGRNLLREKTQHAPSLLEVRYRHAIEPKDKFRMVPGYKNFQVIKPGEIVAEDKYGSIKATELGHILMPLYQGLGDDGFFLARRVNRFWLAVSSLMRYLKLYKLVGILPGVRRFPGRKDTLIVNTEIAKWFAIELFHLLGFRRLQSINAREMILTRRKYDIIGPTHLYK